MLLVTNRGKTSHENCSTVKPCPLQAGSMKRTKKLAAQISIRLEEDVKAFLEEVAQLEDRSLSSQINRILRQWVEMEAAARKKPKAKG